MPVSFKRLNQGFTLVELLIVIVIFSVLVALFLPRFWEVSRQAKIANLEGIAGAMKSSAAITKAKAISEGVPIGATWPGNGGGQDQFIIQMEGLNVEVDWYTLCPESRAERGEDAGATMLDFISLTANRQLPASPIDGSLYTQVDNQYTRVGYDIRADAPGGCYVEYNSYGDRSGDRDCTVTVEFDDC